MESLVLFKKETGKILKVQSKPKGGGSLPSFKAICKSIYVYNFEERDDLKTIKIGREIRTSVAKKYFIVKESEFVKKPSIALEKDFKNNKLIFTVNTSEQEYSFPKENIEIEINGETISISFSTNKKEISVEGEDISKLEVKVTDYRFVNEFIS